VDRHRLDADPDQNFHFDGYPDPDRRQNDADPLADPTPGFTMLWKIRIFENFIHINACSQCFSFRISAVGVIILSFQIFWKGTGNKYIFLELITIRIRIHNTGFNT
jgi:hypothetical protein